MDFFKVQQFGVKLREFAMFFASSEVLFIPEGDHALVVPDYRAILRDEVNEEEYYPILILSRHQSSPFDDEILFLKKENLDWFNLNPFLLESLKLVFNFPYIAVYYMKYTDICNLVDRRYNCIEIREIQEVV